MKSETLNDVMLKRYLLDDISDAERERVEEQFFQDDTFFDEMVALEDELYYDYQQNRLNPHERKVFEQKFLKSREDLEKAAFASAFLETTAALAKEKAETQEKPAAVSWWQSIVAFFDLSGSMMQYGMAAAVLLLALGMIALFIQNSRLKDEMAGLQNKQTQEKQEQEKILAEKQRQQTELEQQLADEKSQTEQNEKRIQEIEAARTKLESEIAEARKRINQTPPNPVPKNTVSTPQSSIIALVLFPGGGNRDGAGGVSKINLSPAVKNVRLRLSLKNEAEYISYDAVVKNFDDKGVVWTSSQLKTQGKGAKKSISLTIPAKNLQRGDYEISLIGITAAGEREVLIPYYFSALK